MYKDKICPICKQPFTPKSSRQKYCNSTIEKICAVCGKPFLDKCSIDQRNTCSKECAGIYSAKQSQISIHSKEIQCKLCGEWFHPKSNTQTICNREHFRKCEVCGKSFKIERISSSTSYSEIRRTCSKECENVLRFKSGNPFSLQQCRDKAKITYLHKTGYDSPMHNPEVLSKIRETTSERYGVDWYTKSKEYIDKCKQSNNEKYGVDWPMQIKEIQEKSMQTLYEHYGVTHTMQSKDIITKMWSDYRERTGYSHTSHNPEVMEKVKATCLERYGNEHAIASKYVREKSKKTMLERYGVENPTQNTDVLRKLKSTCIDRYGHTCYLASSESRKKLADKVKKVHGVDHFSKSLEYKVKMISDPSKVNAWMSFLNDPVEFLTAKFIGKPTMREISELCGVSDSTTGYWVHKFEIDDKVKFSLSNMENSVINYILSVNPDMTVLKHVRNIISPYELDIYLPTLHIAIECNPTYTHNSSIPSFQDSKPKSYTYHKMKTDMCEEQGIFLFHIFGYEWEHRRGIIESMIRNILNANERKVYARNTYVKEVDTKSARVFLDENHRQGYSNSSLRLGLYTKTDDELISLMTFGNMRSTIGQGKDTPEGCYELARFCNKKNTTVVGGASKLFTHFLNQVHPMYVRSFSDRAHTRGYLYSTLGFKQVRTSDPGYVWIDANTDVAYHRMNAQKQNIRQFLHDDSIDIEHMTEKEIMESHGFLRVFDSGTILWEYVAF